MEGGDALKAEGDPLQLLTALQRLLDKQTEEEKEEEEEADTTPQNETNAAVSNTSSDEQEPLFESPEFAEANDDITITTESCGVRVDVAQMAAIAQEQTYVNGKAEGECSDTLTRYPLTQKYNTCPAYVDTENLIVYEQFTLVYTDPNDGEVEAQGCTINEDNPLPVTETTEGCGISHDFDAGVSYQQSKLTYVDNGLVVTLQDCLNSETEYPHTITQDGCTPIVVDDTVTFQEKVTIEVDGIVSTILECQPNPDTTTTVEVELCASPKYTHEFENDISYRNKSYYYMEEDTKVYVSECIASDETYTHMQDTSACSASHDDVGKVTTMRARDYITEEDGSQLYIANCEDISPTIPYVQTAERWAINSSTTGTLQLTNQDANYISKIVSVGSPSPLIYRTHNNPIGFEPPVKPDNFSKMPRFRHSGHEQTRVTGQYFCIVNSLNPEWTLINGVNISESQSNSQPYYTNSLAVTGQSAVNTNYAFNLYLRTTSNPGTMNGTWSCSQPTCLHTHLKAHPVWQRGDLSEFLDASTTTDNLHICGDGSHLDGTNK